MILFIMPEVPVRVGTLYIILVYLYAETVIFKCFYMYFICRMIELDEAIEALDAAIEYKNDNINSKKLELRHSQILSQVRQLLRMNKD